VVVVEDLSAFQFRYGTQVPVAGQWDGQLSNNREVITLVAAGVTIQQFAYDDEWHPSTDGDGPSLEVIDVAAADLTSWNRADNWRPSHTASGTPGRGADRPGDSNHDGLFSSADLVLVFQAGEYEDAVAGNSTFEEGDWNADGDFDTRDLVLAFTLGDYSQAAVPGGDAAAIDWLFANTRLRRRAALVP
jgi:hypothetical protein